MSLLNSTQYIKAVQEHYEAYTNKGEFICSGGSFDECSNKVLDLIRAEAKMLQPVSV